MCTVDVTPYLIEVRDGQIDVVRTDGLYHCRNFNKLVEWAEENIVHPYNITQERIRAIEEVKKQNSFIFPISLIPDSALTRILLSHSSYTCVLFPYLDDRHE